MDRHIQGLEEIYRLFPALENLSASARSEFEQFAIMQQFSAGTILSSVGQDCEYNLMALQGSIKVYKTAASGRMITLYRIQPGESCILTASCILSRKKFPAYAVAETDTSVALIPSALFRTWLTASPQWQQYLFDLLANRLESTLNILDDIAFKPVEERLFAYLRAQASPLTGKVHLTHQEIANEIGSSREVVSRIMKEFEKQHLVSLKRGEIKLLT